MDDLREQHLRAWTERRDDETRAMLASARSLPLPGHAWRSEGQCPLCGVVGKHDDLDARIERERREEHRLEALDGAREVNGGGEGED